jgi:phosphate transport system permease protein
MKAKNLSVHDRLRQKSTKNKVSNGIFSFFIYLLSIAMVAPLLLILAFIFLKGASHINWGLFIHDERSGGILNAIIGSLLMTGVSTLVAVPLSILTGIYLSESRRGKIAEYVRVSVDVLQGVPSIILGIIAYVWMVVPLHHFSALSGSVALAIMMMPIVIKNTEESLKLVPDALKEGAYALGAPRHRVLLQIVLPAGASGVLTGVLVGVSRVLGETAPLLFTAFGNRDAHANLGKPIQALPPLIYSYATSPNEDWINTAWAASFILVAFVLFLNLSTKLLSRKWKTQR